MLQFIFAKSQFQFYQKVILWRLTVFIVIVLLWLIYQINDVIRRYVIFVDGNFKQNNHNQYHNHHIINITIIMKTTTIIFGQIRIKYLCKSTINNVGQIIVIPFSSRWNTILILLLMHYNAWLKTFVIFKCFIYRHEF